MKQSDLAANQCIGGNRFSPTSPFLDFKAAAERSESDSEITKGPIPTAQSIMGAVNFRSLASGSHAVAEKWAVMRTDWLTGCQELLHAGHAYISLSGTSRLQ